MKIYQRKFVKLDISTLESISLKKNNLEYKQIIKKSEIGFIIKFKTNKLNTNSIVRWTLMVGFWLILKKITIILIIYMDSLIF